MNKKDKCKMEGCEKESTVRGYCKNCYQRLVRNGKLKQNKHKNCLIYEHGLNDMPRGWIIENELNKKIYQYWKDMLKRCYSKEYQEKHPTYKDCYVCKRWLILSNFVEDLSKIDGYELWLNNPNKRICLDKDIKKENNKCYNIENCMFIENKENVKESLFRNKKYRKVVRIDGNGNIKIYNSIWSTEKEDGFTYSSVYRCCTGKHKTHKGYKWMFLDEFKKIKESEMFEHEREN